MSSGKWRPFCLVLNVLMVVYRNSIFGQPVHSGGDGELTSRIRKCRSAVTAPKQSVYDYDFCNIILQKCAKTKHVVDSAKCISSECIRCICFYVITSADGEGYVFTAVGLFVFLCVCKQHYGKTAERIFIKFSG